MENRDPKQTENTDPEHREEPHQPHKPIEHDYAKHQADPGPSPQAVKEKDINGAAVVLRWIIPVLVIILLIYWLITRG